MRVLMARLVGRCPLGAHRCFSSHTVLVFGANTDVGKSVVSAGLCRYVLKPREGKQNSVLYLKPVQTGADTDLCMVGKYLGLSQDLAVVTREGPLTRVKYGSPPVFEGVCPFSWKTPTSPHHAANLEDYHVNDMELVSQVDTLLDMYRRQAQQQHGLVRLALVEGAGGPLSPAPSGTLQADVYTQMNLGESHKTMLVADPHLGGISTTMCALEALQRRGFQVDVVVVLDACSTEGNGLNSDTLKDLLYPIPVISLPRVLPQPQPLHAWYESTDAQFSQLLRILTDSSAQKTSETGQAQSPAEAVGSDAPDTDWVLAVDKKHIWHPYTSMVGRPPMVHVSSTKQVRLTLPDGRSLIDGRSSWWAAIHGYNHPALIAALKAQADLMPHVMFGGITHAPAAALTKSLCKLTPPGLDQVFLCDSGTSLFLARFLFKIMRLN